MIDSILSLEKKDTEQGDLSHTWLGFLNWHRFGDWFGNVKRTGDTHALQPSNLSSAKQTFVHKGYTEKYYHSIVCDSKTVEIKAV
jgi:hypothetical protein